MDFSIVYLAFFHLTADSPVPIRREMTGSSVLLYADDSVLLVSDKDPRAVSDTLSKELESCNEWIVDNRLSLHLGKTEAML